MSYSIHNNGHLTASVQDLMLAYELVSEAYNGGKGRNTITLVDDRGYEAFRLEAVRPKVEGIEVPEDLCPKGQAAAQAIVDLMIRTQNTETCGCRAFYSPKDWNQTLHPGVVLVLVYDGGDLANLVDTRQDLLTRELDKLELGFEPYSNWYGVVYSEK
jgi:hypothetical protein